MFVIPVFLWWNGRWRKECPQLTSLRGWQWSNPQQRNPVSNEMDSNDQHLRLSLYIQMHIMALTHLYSHEHENVHACTHVIPININIHHSHTGKMRQKTAWQVFSLFLDLFCVCTHPYVCTVYVTVHVWRSKNNLHKSWFRLSTFTWVPGIQLRSSSGLAASILDPLSHLASSLEILFLKKDYLFINLLCI